MNIEDYLHHRPPYLFIEKVIESDATQIMTQSHIKPEMSFLKGHFPGAPIVPGALMHEMTTQSAGILIAKHYNPMKDFNTHDPFHNEYALGVLHKTHYARYKGFARIHDTLEIKVKLLEKLDTIFRFKGEIFCQNKSLMKNEFTLCNIKSSVLQGKEDVSLGQKRL